MQSRQPLQVSAWMYTVSNSVRMIAPVGQTSRQAALTQCLQTSDIISQRPSVRSSRELLDELDVPPVDAVETARCCRSCRRSARACRRSVAGSSFHWWQATSHALQPMQTVVSV